MDRKCKIDPDKFCYICGVHIKWNDPKLLLSERKLLCKAYQAYFGISIMHQEKTWVPHSACNACTKTLEGWYRGESRFLKFSYPRTWCEPSNHVDGCYFCLPIKARERNTFEKACTISLCSSEAPTVHDRSVKPPTPPVRIEKPERLSDSSSEEETSSESDAPMEQCLPSEKEVNDLVKDLGLSIAQAELLKSRLKQWRCIDKTVRVTSERSRHHRIASFFKTLNKLTFCYDINGLFNEIGLEHCSTSWRLFIDSSCKSLKAVLLHNDNKLPSVPIGYADDLKESYESTKLLLESISYKRYNWEVIGDFKMIGFLQGFQAGFTKYPCMFCLFDSRARAEHYSRKAWPTRSEIVFGKNNQLNSPLVEASKVLLPPLHLKLGLMRQFITALDRESEAIAFLISLFPKLSTAKIYAGIFTGPQIRKVMNSVEFPLLLDVHEKAAWKYFVAVATGFLGNYRDPNYEKNIEGLLESYRKMGCKMSLKVHMFHSHLDKFKENLGAYSEEQGERFHQDLATMEKRFRSGSPEHMLGDFIWNSLRETAVKNKKKSPRKSFCPQ